MTIESQTHKNLQWCQYIMADTRVLSSTVWAWNGEDLIVLTRSIKIKVEVIPAHWNKFWGPTESLLWRWRGGNVVNASMLAQIVTMLAQIVDESSYITALSNNGSYLTTRSSPFQVHTVDNL